jgi:hypothetical protein
VFRSAQKQKLRLAATSVALAILASVILPVAVVSADTDRVVSDNNNSVSSAEVKNALQSVSGVLNASDQLATSADTDSAATTHVDGTVVDIPKEAEQGVTFGAESGTKLDISLPNAEAATAARQVAPGVVAYDSGNGSANAVQPTEDGGVRMLTIIDNPNAPTEYEYKVTVPGGGRIELSDYGGAVVLSEGGAVVTAVDVPWARDAAGQSIDSWFTTDGYTLTQHVRHSVVGVVYPVVADPYYMGYYMNNAEWSWCKWPSRYNLCYRAFNLSNEATRGAEYLNRISGWGLHNGWADAVRHCYWSGLMAYHFGYDTAKGFGDRHEQTPGQDPREKNMDLHNNEMGRRWARASGGVWERCILGAKRKELRLL